MAKLLITHGPSAGKELTIPGDGIILGRSTEIDLTLAGTNVSRRHARVFRDGITFFIEDLGSSNGTFHNGHRITEKVRLRHGDVIRIGSHTLHFEEFGGMHVRDAELTIQRITAANASNAEIYRENAGQKLQAVLDMAHHLVHALDPAQLLEKMADQLLRLFPHADRVLVISFKDREPRVRVNRNRKGSSQDAPEFSRSVLQKVLTEGTAMLAKDTDTLAENVTLQALGVRSVLCVPLRSQGRPVFGAVQLDRFQLGNPFTEEDLYLLTAVTLQVSVVLENANLHQELLARERIERDLAMAREIQEGYLPKEPPKLDCCALDLFAQLHPAQEVSGDFYDYMALDAQRVAFTVADVSGKGLPAALFMTMIRTLWRQLAPLCVSPAQLFERLNAAVARDNPKFMYVTMLLGVYDAGRHECLLSRAGHPPPLVRKADGSIEELKVPRGALIGIADPCPPFGDSMVRLDPGDTLFFYTDGVTEASKLPFPEMFGMDRLRAALAGVVGGSPLPAWGAHLRKELDTFSGEAGPQDDVTLLFLRRPAGV